MSEKPIDSDLVARARAGDGEAFGELYRRYFDPIFRYLRLRLADEADAEDLAATVFLRAYRGLGRYRERGHPFSAFLYQTARHALVDHYRKAGREVGLDTVGDLAESTAGLDDHVARQETIDKMRRALAALSEDHQEVIRLRLLLELPTQTVAQWMGRSEGAIRVLLFRALEALRRAMKDAS
jgi:RNA polymerase sigma-70 factor (ECF subfamily)